MSPASSLPTPPLIYLIQLKESMDEKGGDEYEDETGDEDAESDDEEEA
jgi:hypothetical protein